MEYLENLKKCCTVYLSDNIGDLKLKKLIDKEVLEFQVKTGAGGKVFGSVSAKQIVEELKNNGFNIDKKQVKINNKDIVVMNFTHYFITEQNYNPVVVHGINDEIWYDYISEMKNERAVVKLRGLYNIIQYNGELLSDEWFKSVKCFETDWYDFEDIYIVQNDEKQYNILDAYGDLTLPYWVDDILETPQEDVVKIIKNGKFNIINYNGKVLFNEWFDEINLEFEKLASDNGDFFAVCKDGKWNFYSEEIGLGSRIWFDEIRNVYNDIGEAKVYIDGNGYWFDPNFQILSGDENTERIDVSFEEEAYKYGNNLNYIKNERKPFNWIKYIKIFLGDFI